MSNTYTFTVVATTTIEVEGKNGFDALKSAHEKMLGVNILIADPDGSAEYPLQGASTTGVFKVEEVIVGKYSTGD